MAEDLRDILMKLEVTTGLHIEAECTAIIEANPKIGAKDELASGFTAQNLAGGRRTNYFSIDEFTFPLALIDADDEEDSETRRQRQHEEKLQMLLEASQEGKGMRARRKTEFTRFMTQGRRTARERSYPADLEQITITKRFDVSSTNIFRLCKDNKTLFGASILKRKPIGDQSLRTYLRLDFTDVLITDLSWEDGDFVKEQFKFVCRKAEVTYCMEGPSTDTRTAPKLCKMPTTSWSVLDLDK